MHSVVNVKPFEKRESLGIILNFIDKIELLFVFHDALCLGGPLSSLVVNA